MFLVYRSCNANLLHIWTRTLNKSHKFHIQELRIHPSLRVRWYWLDAKLCRNLIIWLISNPQCVVKYIHQSAIWLWKRLQTLFRIIMNIWPVITLSNICGVLWQKQVPRAGTMNYILQILWGVITCPCPQHLLSSSTTFIVLRYINLAFLINKNK